MDQESDLLRPKPAAEDFVDGINIEDVQYSSLRDDLDGDARDFEAPTWSLAVDQDYMKMFSKEAVKRQDVIHELIQTEINHVRVLKVMLGVYSRVIRDSLLMDESQLERLFPQLDRLLYEHQNFLDRMKNRRKESLEEGSDKNYCIRHIGDVLVTQFSDDVRMRLQDTYGIFCSRHTEAVNFYKDQLQNNKKFYNLMRKMSGMAIVRRLGVPEGILLITQRITKYPVLVERLIKNTEAGSEEYDDLVRALDYLKETITTVDTQVHQYEQLRDVVALIDSKSQGRMSSGRMIRREALLQNNRKLLREGVINWKSQNRSKVLKVMMVLLPDLLLLLQEKDQKYIFAPLEGGPAVLPLQKLIVREAAHSDRVMFLILAADPKALMYEFHTSSSEERSSWRRHIWEAIEMCPRVEDDESWQIVDPEDVFTEKQRDVQDQLCERDALIEDLLRQKLQIMCDLTAETPLDTAGTGRRLLLRGSATELQQGEQFINQAITHAESLNMMQQDREINPYSPSEQSHDVELNRKPEPFPVYTRTRTSADGFHSRDQRLNSDPHLRDLYIDSLELSADEESSPPFPPPPPPVHAPQPQAATTLRLIQTLYSLKALVAQQDSELELLRAAQSERERPSRLRNTILDQERQRHLEEQRQQLLHLQKIHAQQRQEQELWARERQRHLLETHEAMQELSSREENCTREQARLAAEREELSRNRAEYQQDLERLRDSTRSVEREKEKLDHMMKKYKKYDTLTSMGVAPFLETLQVQNKQASVPAYPSAEDPALSPKSHVQPSPFQERPPLVPPRKESINTAAIYKSDVPVHLVSTTNQVLKSSTVQQQIPTRLAMSKGKDKSKNKGSHHRTYTAAALEVPDQFPIRLTMKEGGSLRALPSTSPRSLHPEMFIHPEESANAVRKASNLKPNHRRSKSSSQDDILYL
ncbi:rho guanine nucleotide exchange factor 18a [Trichomycterus rosablanca]|uniref:rho guanine nucleotide exchange factor 18a n=1 Tax=Trichomycterus rosablanca TaxID=2290929 RepID=UPI002F357BD1